MKEIQIFESKIFQATELGLVVNGNPTFEQWSDGLQILFRANRACRWTLGDMLNYGEAAYGEKYAQALQNTDYELSTLQNIASVAKRIPQINRNPNLRFSTHRAVASLPFDEQKKILDKADLNGWTEIETADAVQQFKGMLENKTSPHGEVVLPENEPKTVQKDEIANPDRSTCTNKQPSKEPDTDPNFVVDVPKNCDKHDQIQTVFNRKNEMRELVGDLNRIRRIITEAKDNEDPLYKYVRLNDVQVNLDNVKRAISKSMPHEVCPMCSGDGCNVCYDCGWVDKLRYETATKEIGK